MTDLMLAHSTLVAMVIIVLACGVIAAIRPRAPAPRRVPIRTRRR